MELQTFNPPDGMRRVARFFGRQKINIHDAAAPVPHARNPVSGAVDICLLSDHPAADWQRRFAEYGIAIEHGPVVGRQARRGRSGRSMCAIPTAT